MNAYARGRAAAEAFYALYAVAHHTVHNIVFPQPGGPRYAFTGKQNSRVTAGPRRAQPDATRQISGKCLPIKLKPTNITGRFSVSESGQAKYTSAEIPG